MILPKNPLMRYLYVSYISSNPDFSKPKEKPLRKESSLNQYFPESLEEFEFSSNSETKAQISVEKGTIRISLQNYNYTLTKIIPKNHLILNNGVKIENPVAVVVYGNDDIILDSNGKERVYKKVTEEDRLKLSEFGLMQREKEKDDAGKYFVEILKAKRGIFSKYSWHNANEDNLFPTKVLTNLNLEKNKFKSDNRKLNENKYLNLAATRLM